MGWASNGVVNNGTAGAILADTGALAIGLQRFTILAWSDVGGIIEVAQRNAANTNDVNVQQFTWLYSQPLVLADLPITLSLLNQRIVVRTQNPYTGNFQVSILW